ncbi:PREDICTED: protein Lines homolog [Elephantulus edwardii]|uniref:protein Lines homolog n=1 Tax=Elephantulus edwardii TaxID=28737 RepID=UPI0003F08AD7|nr:PREDICTED: protein Lines homolog [Elephantulus edwardii]
MKTFCEVLAQLYKNILLGASLENDMKNEKDDYIFYLNPAFLDEDCSKVTSTERSAHQPCSVSVAAVSVAPMCLKKFPEISSAREIMLLQLTVIRVMIDRILSVKTEFQMKKKYRTLVKSLLRSYQVDSKLICVFQSSDKLLSHMTAECLALLLYFQLRENITLSNSGITFCQKNLSEYSESNTVVYCLRTLTVIIKEIFKDTCAQKTEILRAFLAPFDTTFEVFYISLLSQHFESIQETSKVISSLIGFLELLELLTASRLYLKLFYTCQRIFFLKPTCVLDVPTWPIPGFVKRKFIIFIKKCLLCKVSEDLFRGCAPVLMPTDPLFYGDMLTVANAVLQAVNLGWLRTLSVLGNPARFGGENTQPGKDSNSGLDHVTLRAAALVLIKSLEIRVQNCPSPKEIQVDLQRYMSELLNFLKPYLQPFPRLHSPCEWLSRIFIEQDDDMLEAAKALLEVYLKLSRECCLTTDNSTQEKQMWNHHTHENGYNPHCIFLFFLKSIGFDSTVLLDFLISSETCFLEYFVKYLKLLQKDWYNFFTICKYFDAPESKDGVTICTPLTDPDRSIDQTEPHFWTILGDQIDASAWPSWASGDSSDPLESQSDCYQAMIPNKSHFRLQTASWSSPQTSQSLVDYDSSDDSEEESTFQCLANRKQTSLHQEAVKKIQDTSAISKGEKELTLELHSGSLVPEESNYSFCDDHEVSQKSTVSEVWRAYRTVKCLERLQGAIYRLQKKNLFPYNPTALLKLLKSVTALYNKSMHPL